MAKTVLFGDANLKPPTAPKHEPPRIPLIAREKLFKEEDLAKANPASNGIRPLEGQDYAAPGQFPAPPVMPVIPVLKIELQDEPSVQSISPARQWRSLRPPPLEPSHFVRNTLLLSLLAVSLVLAVGILAFLHHQY